jgi:hypothetical protein
VSEHFRSLEGDPEPGDTCPCCGTFNATPADEGCAHRVAWRWDGQTEVFGAAVALERAYREMNSRLEYAEAGGSKAAGPRGEGLLRLAADGADIGDVLVDLVGVRLGDGWSTNGMLGGSGENLYLDDPASLEGWAAECDALCRDV